MKKEIIENIKNLVDRGAIFYISHSGGKDSQCMFLEMIKIVPKNQIVVIHAHLPEVEWKGTRRHIRNTMHPMFTFNYIEVRNERKTFFEMVDHRQMFPGPRFRNCTSDLKVNPIDKAIRADLKYRNKLLAVVCMGLRAEESTGRAKKEAFQIHKRLSKAGREVYDMLPIHDYLVGQVFQTIKDNGQEPHWAYAAGMSRLSCCFCIMASKGDLTVSAKQNPELYRKYVLKERELDFTLQQGKTLEETTGIKIEEQS